MASAKPFVGILLGGTKSDRQPVCQKLAKKYRLTDISPHILINEELQKGTKLSIEIKNFTSNNEKVPSKLILKLFQEKLRGKSGGFILNGFPRDEQTYKEFEEAVCDISLMIHLKFNEASMKRKCQEGRKRTTNVTKAIEDEKKICTLYEKRKLLVQVDGESSFKVLLREIYSAIAKKNIVIKSDETQLISGAGVEEAAKHNKPIKPEHRDPAVAQYPLVVQGKNTVTPEVEAAMADFVKNTLAKGVAGLRKEFAELKVYTATEYKFEAFSNPTNVPRNRYKDVVCLDGSRVVLNLNVPPESDYIHANVVKFEGMERTYIATQGPLETTIPDFWRLVHQESATSVVMLCKCIEDGKNKCSHYFPDANSYKNYGCMFINNKKTETTGEDKLLIHTIEALPEGCSNSTVVKLLQMNDWPDRGVPEKPMSVLRMLRAIPPSGVCIMHCSAGVGRTGTVILIDAILNRLLKGQMCNVKEMFHHLRNQRASAVQAESQYVLIHTCVLEYIRAKMPGKYRDSASQFAEEVKNAKLV